MPSRVGIASAASGQSADSNLDRLVHGLRTNGYAVSPQFVPAALVARLRSELILTERNSGLRAATVGQGQESRRQADIRNDRICWIDNDCSSAALAECLVHFDQMRQALNKKLFLGLFEFECHFSLYPPGARYARHLDQFRNDDRRRVSCVLYLNDDWEENDGGALRLYRGENRGCQDFVPYGGTLVAFLSAQFEHEVLPARRPRYSLTGWFKVRG